MADRRATDALFAAQIAEVLALFTALNPLNVARRLTGEEKFDSLMRARDEGRLDEESRAAARAVEKLQAQIGELYGHVQRGHFSSSRLTDILHKIGSEVGRELLEFDDD
ncbi:hypothetical protein [Pedococcus sp. 2YAF34]|uniref:hypothetical protein n=1 Tax=Pedococcus sp. 2YAF34 TaxID=3233032 RepID=UPI003F977CBB